MERSFEEKKERLMASLEKGVAQLHLDARMPGVLVPDHLRIQHHLVLNFSFRFDPPDLTVNDWGVRETLSFGGKRSPVAIPWSAVYAVASLSTRDFWMFPDAMPVELAQAAVERVNTENLPKADVAAPDQRPMLREIVMPERDPEDQPKPDESTPPRRGHLRIVK